MGLKTTEDALRVASLVSGMQTTGLEKKRRDLRMSIYGRTDCTWMHGQVHVWKSGLVLD